MGMLITSPDELAPFCIPRGNMDLVKKREQVIARHIMMESIPESSWHPRHSSTSVLSGHAKLSDRPIAFLCDDEVVVIGNCVPKIIAGLKQFLAMADKEPEKWAKRRAKEPAVENAWAKIERLANGPQPQEIRMGQGAWNGILLGLGEVNVDVALTDGTYD